MKAWTGKKRLAKKLNRDYFKRPWYRKTADYLLAAVPGTVVHTCDGLNHRVKEILPFYRDASMMKGWRGSGRGSSSTRTKIISEIEVTDESGELHLFPGGGCVSMPQTREQIEDYHRSWDNPKAEETIVNWEFVSTRVYIDFLRRGLHIVDEDGILLPEVDRVVKEAARQLNAYKDEIKNRTTT